MKLEPLIKRKKLRCCIDSHSLGYSSSGLNFGMTGYAEAYPELKGKKDILVRNPWIFYPDDEGIRSTVVDKKELYIR